MTDREKLIELLRKGYNETPFYEDIWEGLADYLLANGAIVPPYKCGSKVYVITSQTSNNRNFYIFEDIITHYIVTKDFTTMCFENHIGESSHKWGNVFLTKEEAEKALENLKNTK